MRQVTLTRDRIHAGPLILVNPAHPLRGEALDLVAADERWPEILLERRAARLLGACIQAIGGEAAIVPVSGWRSQREQQAIWDETWEREGEIFTRQYVALPGCSEHQTGLAIDLGKAAPEIDFIRPDFPLDGLCGAFRRCAARYGFIQRYRREKEALTGIAEEPWHFRYVGAPTRRCWRRTGCVWRSTGTSSPKDPGCAAWRAAGRPACPMCPARGRRWS